jgi:DNA mismatch repair protein MutS
MLQQYFQAKDAHPGVIMAMRVGDFYEFYGEDAETAAAVLGITLTGREDGENGRIAMAGVPYHSVEKYLAKIVQSGMKVALCDQVEDPKTAKGLVRRAVTRVMTPGTVMEDSMLSGASNNFLNPARESRRLIPRPENS